MPQGAGPGRWAPLLVAAAAAAVVAVVGFGVPVGTVLVVGLLLLCPLSMAAMHGGHGHGAPREQGQGDRGTQGHGEHGPPGGQDPPGRG